MANGIESWVQETLAEAEYRWKGCTAQGQDDTFGWGAILTALVRDDPDVAGTGLLLTGPEGCGKHTAARYMMALLEEEEAYQPVFLNGLEFSTLGAQASIQRLEALLNHFQEQEQPLCILLEEMEDCACRREVLYYLGKQLINNWVAEDCPPLCLLLIDDMQQPIPAILRERLRLCRMCLPDLKHRALFLKENAKTIRDAVSLKVFAQATEGASYGKLLDMICNVQGLLDSNGNRLDDQELTDFLAGQLPPPKEEDGVQTLARSVQALADQLPELIKQAAAGVPQVITTPAQVNQLPPKDPALQDQAQYLSNKRQEIENMPTPDLINDLFGKERAEEMRQQIQLRQ